MKTKTKSLHRVKSTIITLKFEQFNDLTMSISNSKILFFLADSLYVFKDFGQKLNLHSKTVNWSYIIIFWVGPFLKIGRHLLGRFAKIGHNRTGVGG